MEGIQAALAKGEDPRELDHMGQSLLHVAAEVRSGI
jgi:hypothetical protein